MEENGGKADAGCDGGGGGGLLSRVKLPHQLLLALSLLQLSVMLLDRRLFCRHRTAANVDLRSVRLFVQLWQATLDPATAVRWRARTHAAGADLQRTLAVSLAGVLLGFMQQAVMHPVPATAALPFAAAALAVFPYGWLGTLRPAWEHPRVAPAAGALCGKLQLVLVGLNSAATATFGWAAMHACERLPCMPVSS